MVDRLELELWQQGSQPIICPLVTTGGPVFRGRARLHGWSWSTGTDPVQAYFVDGQDQNGAPAGFAGGPASTAGSTYFSGRGVRIESGLYVNFTNSKAFLGLVVYAKLLDE